MGSRFGPVVTVSATYGAGGSLLAPRLAEELQLPFIDRLITADMSDAAARGIRSEEGLMEGEQASSPTGRFLSYFARAASVGAIVAPEPMLEDDDSIRRQSEAYLDHLVAGDPAVVLGRAGALALRTRPRAYHIRLDAPVEQRRQWAAEIEGLDPDAVTRRQEEADRARALFVKRLYRVDPADPSLYHLVLDPTVLGIDAALRVLVTAATAFFEAHP
jgi:cytidylate kinase